MFEVGFTELLLISALALLVLGPQKLPKLAQQVGRWMGRARAMARQFREQLEEEAHTLETQLKIDPGIDTSLEPRKPTSTPLTPSAAAAAAAAATTTPDAPASASGAPETPAATTSPDAPEQAAPAEATVVTPPDYPEYVEEEFYPPDHHMHPANRARAAEDTGAGAQGELDLTTASASDEPRDPT